jgi:hypothetical protein
MVVRMLMIMLMLVEEASRQRADSKLDNQLDDFKNQPLRIRQWVGVAWHRADVAETNAWVSAMFCLTSALV